MDVLVTGATGYIGRAVAEALDSAGHTVHALVHDNGARIEVASGQWKQVAGDLREYPVLERLARSVDAVVHAANTGGADAPDVDTGATRAFLRGLHRTAKPFVYTSGAWVLGSGVSDEASPLNPPALVAWRAPLEAEVLGAAPGVRTVVVRPGIAYGRAGGIPGMVARGDLPVIGTGTQLWPLVHVEDLAEVYVRALGAPGGSILHGVTTSLAMRDLALLGAARNPGASPEVAELKDARSRFGPFADALALDQIVSSARTREMLGWTPHRPSPVEEMLNGSYAAAVPARLLG